MSYRDMTKMEVEVDMAQPLSFDGHAEDEDLIDYDIDTTEQHQHQTYLSPLADSSFPDAHTDVSMDLHSKHGDELSDADEARPTEEENDMHNEMLLDEVARADEDMANEERSYQDSFAEDANVHGDSKDGTTDLTVVATLDAHKSDNEIDYEEYEHEAASAAGHSFQEHETLEEAAQHPEAKHDENPAENDDSAVTPTNLTAEANLTTSEQGTMEPRTDEYEHDEINWEHEDATNENPLSHEENSSRLGEEAVDESAHENQGEDSEARPDREEAEDDTSENPFYNEQNDDDIDSNHDEIEAVVELEEASFKSGLKTEPENFPQITVQYKGDEFPFFSLEASEGFFSDHLVLDFGMESLLAGFRAELSNEIAAGEELVFQVDELGLEFSESLLQGPLSSITLRQILEIFDLLVKNQDPNSTKTLYTYLSTKPSTSKRFDFLIESAAAGKGLDEVIHLFQPAMPLNAAFVDLAQIADSVDDHIDSYRSSSAEIEGTNEDISESGAHEATEENEEDDEGGAWTEDVQYSVNRRRDAADESLVAEEELERDDAEEQVEEDVEEAVEEVEEAEEVEAEVAEEEAAEKQADAVEEQASQATAAASAYDDTSRQMMSQIFDDPAITADMNDFSEHQSNPLFIHDHVDDEPGDANDSEYGGEELQLASAQSEDGEHHPSVANTVSTNTLADELDTASDLAGIQADEIMSPEALDEVLIDNDALAEIDWRDELDLVDATGRDAPSGAPKRARPDDELGVEEETDVKRRRS